MPEAKRVFLPMLALGALLTACGGGGGGGGGTPAADLSTPQKVAQALVPALTAAASGTVGASNVSMAPAAQPGLKRWSPQGAHVSAKRGAVTPKGVSEPCPAGGSYEYVPVVDKDVNSPFTEALFSGYTDIYRDCEYSESAEGTTYTQYANGRLESDTANGNENIYYERDGTSDSDYVERYTYTTADYEERFRYNSRGTVHGSYNPETQATDERIDINFSFIYIFESAQGSEDIRFSAFLGTADQDFQIASSPTSLFLEGEYGVSSSDFPDCELGRAHVSTPNPLTYDEGSGNLVGLLLLDAGSDAAEVLLKADGSADVTIDGATTTLTAEEIDALIADCPDFDA